MTDRDRAILRTVYYRHKSGKPIPDRERRNESLIYIDIKRLSREGYAISEEGYWRLTPLGEAAIAEGAEEGEGPCVATE